MAWATARHILVETEEECNTLKSDIENAQFSLINGPF